MSRHCPVCGEGDVHTARLYMLPQTLKELGYPSTERWCHISCVTVDRSRMEKRAKSRGQTFEEVVAERRV